YWNGPDSPARMRRTLPEYSSVHATSVSVPQSFGPSSRTSNFLITDIRAPRNAWAVRRRMPAHFRQRRFLGWEHPLDAVAGGFVCALQIPTELFEADGLQTKGMVGTLQRAVQREVMFENPRAVGVGHERHRDSGDMATPADDRLRIPMSHLDDGE